MSEITTALGPTLFSSSGVLGMRFNVGDILKSVTTATMRKKHGDDEGETRAVIGIVNCVYQWVKMGLEMNMPVVGLVGEEKEKWW